MLAEAFNLVFEWIRHNPHWAYFAVFLVAACESLIVVGLIVPGVALMFGIGALVAVGALDLGATLFWAFLGAVAGDGLSFWVGRHFRQRLRAVWPFNRHAAMLGRGVDFFHHHGAKSVVLARFIGPLRPIVPAVAGMLDMAPRRFFAANVLSALLWAPAYTLPGVVFGASLTLAAEVAGRLAALLAVAVCVLWFGLWVVRNVIRVLQPRAGTLVARALDWSRRHPLFQPLTAAVLDPAHPEARGLAVLLALLALVGIPMVWLAFSLLAGLDLYVHAGLQQLRNPAADRAMVLISDLGSNMLVFAVLAAGCTWLAVQNRLHAALHWLAAGVSASLVLVVLRLVRAVPGVLDVAEDVERFGLPSAHTSLSIAVYGFLAVLIARELVPKRRWIPYVGTALVVIPVAFSRLYLGAQTLSDVMTGIAVGLACVALLGIAYRRHPARAVRWPALAMVMGVTLILLLGWRAEYRLEPQLARYAEARELRALGSTQWWLHDWQKLAALRYDLRAQRRQPLRIQYAGDLQSLGQALSESGWHSPLRVSGRNALLWLSPQPVLDELPVLPQLHDGQYDSLRLVRRSPDGQEVYILRLWPSRWRLDRNGERIWVGSVTALELRQPLGVFSYAATGSDHATAFSVLRQDLGERCNSASRTRAVLKTDVLLVRDCSSS